MKAFRRTVAKGDLVMHVNVEGIARVAGVDNGSATLESFESVAHPRAAVLEAPVEECRRVQLSTETRVYHHDPDTGAWRMGRVVGGEPPMYFVRFPNSAYDTIVAEKDLRVRWDRPVSAPLDVLVHGANESPYFRDARMPMLASVVDQRAACAGATSLLSAAVEIHAHQVRAALAVLRDPSPRYLLADEVGLGKTIEAGFVIRQTLLDDPKARIAVVVPEALRRQWEDELVGKFFICDFPQATVKITSHETPEEWSAYHNFDLVVVDEVHALLHGSLPDSSAYVALTALAHTSKGLLLLSATPFLQRESAHLGLLHLLDPALYRWDAIDDFRARLAARRELATLVFALNAEFEYLLPGVVDDIRRSLPQDPLFEELASRAVGMLDVDGTLGDENERPRLVNVIEGLRAHIGETYRLHRRVIRQRRARVIGADVETESIPFEVTGRRPPEVLHGPRAVDPVDDAVVEWLWKMRIEESSEQRDLGSLVALLASRTGGIVDDLRDAVAYRVTGDAEAAARARLTPEDCAVLHGVPVGAADDELLGRLNRLDRESTLLALVEALVPALRACRRLVVFCGPGPLASALVGALTVRFPKASVFEHTRDVAPLRVEEAVTRWTEGRGVLVVDSTADDGRNFQSADGVVHARLPWSPNVLEQRIGRVDRYGSPPAARQFVLADATNLESLVGSWGALLVEGFGVFTESVSALQDGIDRLLPSVWRAAAADGPEGLRGAIPQVRTKLGEERREIERLDNLEASFEAVGGQRDIAAAITAFETEWRRAEDALVSLTGSSAPGSLMLCLRRAGNGTLSFGEGRRAPLMEPRLLARMGTIPQESRSGVFNRNAALRLPGAHMLRVGHPVVDVLADLLAIDDRGQASAQWRFDPSCAHDPAPYFGFDYLVEADLAGAVAVLNESRAPAYLRREADGHLAPFLRRVWIPPEGRAVQSPALVAWLEKPYANNAADRNLGGARQSTLVSLLGGAPEFARAAQAAEQAARRELHRVTDLDAKARDAYDSLAGVLNVIRAQARARRQARALTEDNSAGLLDGDVGTALLAGVAHPSLRLVSVTCLIRAARPWSRDDL